MTFKQLADQWDREADKIEDCPATHVTVEQIAMLRQHVQQLRSVISSEHQALEEWINHIAALSYSRGARGEPPLTQNEISEILPQQFGNNLLNFKDTKFNELLDNFLQQEEENKHISDDEWAKKLGKDISQCDGIPAIEASEIENITGKKVPTWALWVSISKTGRMLLHNKKPIKGVGRYQVADNEGRTDNFGYANHLIPGPWHKSLHYIIHNINNSSEKSESKNIKYLKHSMTDLSRRVSSIENSLKKVSDIFNNDEINK